MGENKPGIGSFFKHYDHLLDAPGDDEKFWKAESAEFMDCIDNLLYACFTSYKIFRITYLFRDKHTTSKGKVCYGTCEKVSDKNKVLQNIDYVITLAWDVWEKLNYKQREALIFHELSHIDYNDNGTPTTAGHDLEFFRNEYRYYGAWNVDLELLENDLRQLDFFNSIKTGQVKITVPDDDENDNNDDDKVLELVSDDAPIDNTPLFVSLVEGESIVLTGELDGYRFGTVFTVTDKGETNLFMREEIDTDNDEFQGSGEAFPASDELINEMFELVE